MTMPYSTVFVPTEGNAHLLIPSAMQNRTATLTNIPAGVAQVIVTWRGTESIQIRHYPGSGYETVHTIPAATTPTTRTSGVLTFSSPNSQALAIVRVGSWSQTTLDRNYVAGVQIIPLATAGGV